VLSWDAITGAASVGTAIVAVLVFVEARRIRHTEWLTRSVQMWQDFNSVLLAENRAERWRSLLAGEVDEQDFRPSDHLLYTYLNIIYSEYTYAKSGLLRRGYAQESLQDNLKQVATICLYIVPWLRFTGYDNELVEHLEALRSGAGVRIPSRIDRLRPDSGSVALVGTREPRRRQDGGREQSCGHNSKQASPA
jgi:hypothetical protein